MSVQVADGDDLDVETLQAQIDLSMSFAQELVSSWIKPSYKSSITSQKNTEKELEEYMRRPPRLGVGAPIPENASMSRESARLKNHLTNKSGNKRARDEEEQAKRQFSDDEEESRAGAIRKKAKLDHFGGVPRDVKKKKPKQNGASGLPTPQGTPSSQKDISSKPKLADAMEVDEDGIKATGSLITSGVETSEHSRKFRKKKKRNSLVAEDRKESIVTPKFASTPSRPLSSPSTPLHEDAPEPRRPSVVSVAFIKDTYPNSLPFQSETQTDTRNPEQTSMDIATSSIATPISSPSHARRKISQGSLALKTPLLNLDGPPLGLEDADDGLGASKDSSPKKKRKRRKKRRSSGMNSTTDTAMRGD